MTYKAVTRIKFGSKEEGFEYVERGDTVSADDFDGGKEELEQLVADGVVMESKQFDVMFPDHEGPANQASGTPSNLEQVEGTTLQPEQPEDKNSNLDETEAVNPADPPKVKDAGTAAGFETKGQNK